MWEPKLKDWEKINIDAYKFIFEQSKIRLNESVNQSETVTERAISLLKLLITLLSVLIAISIKVKISNLSLFILIALCAVDAFFIFKLMIAKNIKAIGAPPKEMFVDNLDRSEYTTDDQVALLYYNEICRTQDGIDKNYSVVKGRIQVYHYALLFTILLMISTFAILALSFKGSL